MKKIPRTVQRVIELLTHKAPPPVPVKVEYGTPEGAFADIGVVKGKFVITISHRLTGALALHFLVHEWAHALCWTGGSTIEEHSDAWGLVYTRLYRLVFED